jgi:hypothetical protein
MVRKVEHSRLNKAKKSKNDEFYTQLVDIERELVYYKEHFKGKIVYCNCDDPAISNFFKYFYQNFKELGLKKLIATGFRSDENPHGKVFQYTGKSDERNRYESNLIPNLEGDGDFREDESLKFLRDADIVVTNPPFSLFRDFVAQMIDFDKKFLVIANVNAITYKEVFSLIQADKIWLGVHLGRGISGFIVPDHYELYGTEARIDNGGNRIVSTNNSLWLTNLDIDKRHENLALLKTYSGNESFYPSYDNFDGINVNKTKDIPSDYEGYIGVPITYLHKHNPDQFELIRFRKGDDGKDLSINGKCPYFRIIIRRKGLGPDPKKSKTVSTRKKYHQEKLF